MARELSVEERAFERAVAERGISGSHEEVARTFHGAGYRAALAAREVPTHFEWPERYEVGETQTTACEIPLDGRSHTSYRKEVGCVACLHAMLRAHEDRLVQLREGMADLGFIVGTNPDGVDDTVAATLLVVKGLRAACEGEGQGSDDPKAALCANCFHRRGMHCGPAPGGPGPCAVARCPCSSYVVRDTEREHEQEDHSVEPCARCGHRRGKHGGPMGVGFPCTVDGCQCSHYVEREHEPAEHQYTIYVCPDCGKGCQLTAALPGCGPRMDDRRSCRCGFRGYFTPVGVTTTRHAEVLAKALDQFFREPQYGDDRGILWRQVEPTLRSLGYPTPVEAA